jgi:hypothetical protein
MMRWFGEVLQEVTRRMGSRLRNADISNEERPDILHDFTQENTQPQVTIHHLPALEAKSKASKATVVVASDANLNSCSYRFT